MAKTKSAAKKADKRGVRKTGSKLKDLNAKGSRNVRGGAIQAYVYFEGKKSGDIK